MKFDLIQTADGEFLTCASENMNEVPVVQRLLDRNGVGHVHAQGETVYINCAGIVKIFAPVLIGTTPAEASGAVALDPSGNPIT